MAAAAALERIRYVWFDQDDTLYCYRDAMHRALDRCLAMIHERYASTRESLGRRELVEIRSEVSRRAEYAELDLIEARRVAFRETLLRYDCGDGGLDEALTAAYYDALQSNITPFPGTADCLRALSERYVLGILSNGMSLIEQLGIADYFEHRIYGLDLRIYKPDPAIYEHAMRLTGGGPEEHLLVGDNRICDVVAAREMGWATVWLNGDGGEWEISADPPELTIGTLCELPPLLESLSDI